MANRPDRRSRYLRSRSAAAASFSAPSLRSRAQRYLHVGAQTIVGVTPDQGWTSFTNDRLDHRPDPESGIDPDGDLGEEPS